MPPVIVTVVLDPLRSLRDFDELRRLQSRAALPCLPYGMYSHPDQMPREAREVFVGFADGLSTLSQAAPQPRVEPIVDPVNNFLLTQKARVDEIERQLGKVIDILSRVEANSRAHSTHLANHDTSIAGLRNVLGNVSSIADQTRKDIADVRAKFGGPATGPSMTPPKPSVNGKPHNNGQCPGGPTGAGGSGPLDVEKH